MAILLIILAICLYEVQILARPITVLNFSSLTTDGDAYRAVVS
jgi:hypothetical protein